MYLINELEIVKISDQESIIVNLINGNADLVNCEIANKIQQKDIENIDNQTKYQLIERKYAFENEEKYFKFIKSFNNKLIDESNKEEPNFIYIPTFECNLNCYYCFEKAYKKNSDSFLNLNNNIEELFKVIDSIISKLEQNYQCVFDRKNIPMLLTGGEPLLCENQGIIEKIIKNCNIREFPVSIVTNGTTIDSYLETFRKYSIENIQITLDGGKTIHDDIRITHEGLGTYDIIVKNLQSIKKYIKNISVRINITEKNIKSIKELGDIIKKNSDVEFYVYIMQQEGCYDFENVIDELEALKYLYELKSQDDTLENLYIAYHGCKIVDGILGKKNFSPKIKMCSAMRNQYIIDNNGGVYKCWWGMGNKDYLVGKIKDQNVEIDDKLVSYYHDRTIFNLEKCRNCKYRYLCGGGCSGRLTRENLKKGEVVCPDFSGILNFVLPKEIQKLRNGKGVYENEN